jgi:hypothetical protein
MRTNIQAHRFQHVGAAGQIDHMTSRDGVRSMLLPVEAWSQ